MEQLKKERKKTMTTDNKKPQQLTINAQLAQHKSIEKVLLALNKMDKARNFTTHETRELLEIMLYARFIQQNEEPNKAVEILLQDDKFELFKAIVGNVPYIAGINSFGLDYNKSNNMIMIRATLKNPYGQYLERLEESGLHFNQRPKETEQIRNQEEMDAIQEANSILASVGLKYFE